MSFASCAKVNLFLYITGRRIDGYHYIRSLFVPISIFDILTVEIGKNKGINIECREKWFDPLNNTLYKAYRFFTQKTGFYPELKIRLVKNIPPGSGLGGASSNAATLLNIMNKLMKIKNGNYLEHKNIIKLAASIGGDVPFFIKSRPALVEGIGEVIKEVKIREELYLVIICPSKPFYTKKMYEEFDKSNRLTNPSKGDKPLPPFWGYNHIAGAVYNVFETTLKGYDLRMIMRIKRTLIEVGATSAALSGSGSAVFGLFNNSEKALSAYSKLINYFGKYKIFIAKVLNKGY
ncbi:MAG: 4-(cytidine 5'-diphospho)-2-C-methyl-D-erythritol kinase [Deltaproteobacteria bacterium]|nr:4-(cytidine 5'-diphospho)-2-C-methyl-D-erythritol kinase [Deltaproteobacteria bacterium]